MSYQIENIFIGKQERNTPVYHFYIHLDSFTYNHKKGKSMLERTEIDTVALQIDFDTDQRQREVLNDLYCFISENGFYIDCKEYGFGGGMKKREYFVYANNATIATLSTGAFRTGSYVNNDYAIKYYITVKFAGLKRYDDVSDTVSYNGLLLVCAYLNTYEIAFKLTELDICIDVECTLEHLVALCVKKSPKTHYYALEERQIFTTTRYIEKMAKKKLGKAVLRAYTYDKMIKESLDTPLSRFELKLQSAYFKKYGFSIESIEKALDRYCVMYFEDLEIKERMIKRYNGYTSVRKREIERMGLDRYRLYPDIAYIDDFIVTLLCVNFFALEFQKPNSGL